MCFFLSEKARKKKCIAVAVSKLLTMADPIRFYIREFIQNSIWGTAHHDKLKSIKKIYGHHAFYFMGGISKVGDE
jgi:hypothetical protein